MPIPDFQTAMLTVLQAFANGADKVSDVLPALIAEFHVTEEERRQLLPSGRVTVLQSRAHWARTYLSKAGLLISPSRNRHVITELGRALLAEGVTRVDMRLLERYPTYRIWKETEGTAVSPEETANSAVSGVETVPPDEQIASAVTRLEVELATELLLAIQAMEPAKFEQLIVDLLLAMGYGGGDRTMGERIGKSGDGGIDGIINEDRLGLDAVYVQAKRYATGSNVGRPAIQAFVGSLTGEAATKGVFVTTSDFSKEAKEFLNRVQHRIVLINGERLARLLIQHEVGVRRVRTVVLRDIDENYFVED